MSLPYTDNVTAISSVTTTTVSGVLDVSKRQQITAEFVSSGFTSGNIVYSIDASNDGVNWVVGIAVQSATATASTTWVTSVTASTTSTVGVYIKSGWRMLRVNAVRTTDGTASVIFQTAG